MLQKYKGTVLVTGGAGYIGSHVNKELNRQGWNTVVYDNLVHGHRDSVKWGDFVLGDLADREQLRLVFRNHQIDAVMHFAAYAYVGESVLEPSKYYANNVANTVNLLETMREFSCRHILFSSTCATYGSPERIPITEEQPQHPINPYGRSKLMIEWILEDYSRAYDMTYVALRYFNAAGADPDGEIGETHNPETHLIPLVLAAGMGLRDSIEIFGTNYPTPDGTCVRDYIHVTDLANAHIKAMKWLYAGGQSDIFNLGTEQGYSVREIIKCAEEVLGKKIPFIETAARLGDPAILIASQKKACKSILFSPTMSPLRNIIETALKWQTQIQSVIPSVSMKARQ